MKPQPERPPGHFLPGAIRAELLRLVAGRPGLTPGQLVKIVESRTGRRIGESTARRYRLGKVAGDPRHLTEAERLTLRRIFAASRPRDTHRAIRRVFVEMTGREITERSVSRFATDVMGYEKRW